MDQPNHAAVVHDAGGVFPMDTGAILNGLHDIVEEQLSSTTNVPQKKGRGRPPKSASSVKPIVQSDRPKRGRGRPPKSNDESVVTAKKSATTNKSKGVSSMNGDVHKKKRGRPSKNTVFDEHINGDDDIDEMNNHQETNGTGPVKRKRGRPFGSLSKKTVATTESDSKPSSSTKKRGRPPGSTNGKNSASKTKLTTGTGGSTKKRGRPRKTADTSVNDLSMNDEVTPPATDMED